MPDAARPMNQTELDLFARSVELIERLCKETERLHGDVGRLLGRIEPFENEQEPPKLSCYRKPKTFRDVIDLIEETRHAVVNCEYAVNAATAKIDQIVVDGWSREDLKPYLKDR